MSLGSDLSAYQQQTCGTGHNGRLLQPFLPSSNFSLQEEPAMSYTPWSSHDDDPDQLIECTWNNKSRNVTDGNDCGSEADLHGWVSDIVEKPDQMDSYYAEEEASFNLKSKSTREQYFQAESKMQPNSAFLPSHVYPEPFNKTQGQPMNRDSEEIYQHFNSLDSSEHWLFASCSGELDTYSPQAQELPKPPGLQLPSVGNSCTLKMRPSKHENSTAEKVGGLCGLVNTLSDHMDSFAPQNKMNSRAFDHYYEDYTDQSSCKSGRTKQYAMQDVNKLASHIQALLVGDQDNTRAREVQNRQTAQMQYEDSLAEQRKFTSPSVSAHSTPTMQVHKEPGGNFGALQRDTDGGKRPLQSDFGSKDLSIFGQQQHVDYFHLPEALSASFNPPNSYQSKLIGQKGKKRDGDLEIQLDKNRTPISGLVGDGFSTRHMDVKTTRPHTGSHTREGDKNLYLDILESLYSSQRFGGGNSNINAGKTPPFLHYMYPVGDPRQNNCHLPTMSSSGFNSRPSLPCGSSVPLIDVCDLLADGEFAAFNPYDLIGSSEEGLYFGMPSTLRSPRMMRNHGEPMSQLRFHLEECYEQWRFLEKERKKTEVILTKSYPVRRISVVSNSALPKVPPKPSRVDHLVVDQFREQARVVSLLGEMERLRSFPLHANISSALDRHQEAIYITQARRKEGFLNTSNRQRQGGAHFREDRDILLLAMALRDLCATTRKSRSAMWCALQMTLPKTSTDHVVCPPDDPTQDLH